MCLIADNNIPSRSKSGITCYKVLHHFNTSKEWYTTLFANYHVSLDYSDTLKSSGRKVIKDTDHGREVHGGYVHTYSSLNDALRIANDFKECNKKCKFTVFECVIPANVEYYYGRTSKDMFSYASDSIRFIKKIKEI